MTTALQEIDRVLKPTGTFICLTYCDPDVMMKVGWGWGWWDQLCGRSYAPNRSGGRGLTHPNPNPNPRKLSFLALGSFVVLLQILCAVGMVFGCVSWAAPSTQLHQPPPPPPQPPKPRPWTRPQNKLHALREPG